MSQVLSDISEVEEELGDCEGSSQVEGSIEELREHGTQLNAKVAKKLSFRLYNISLVVEFILSFQFSAFKWG